MAKVAIKYEKPTPFGRFFQSYSNRAGQSQRLIVVVFHYNNDGLRPTMRYVFVSLT